MAIRKTLSAAEADILRGQWRCINIQLAYWSRFGLLYGRQR